MNNSDPAKTAVGVCSHCKTTITFDANENITTCPKCYDRQTRYLAGAVDKQRQTFGHVPGGGRNP